MAVDYTTHFAYAQCAYIVHALSAGLVGFQFMMDRARVDIAGENPPHEVDLTCDTIAFPNPDRTWRP